MVGSKLSGSSEMLNTTLVFNAPCACTPRGTPADSARALANRADVCTRWRRVSKAGFMENEGKMALQGWHTGKERYDLK